MRYSDSEDGEADIIDEGLHHGKDAKALWREEGVSAVLVWLQLAYDSEDKMLKALDAMNVLPFQLFRTHSCTLGCT